MTTYKGDTMTNIQADYALVEAMFDGERDAILESLSSDVWWDIAADTTVNAAIMVAMSAGWSAARDYALTMAFESLRGSLGDVLPGPSYVDVDGDTIGHVDAERMACTVGVLVASGAAYVAGMSARAGVSL